MPLRAGYKNSQGQGVLNIAAIAEALSYAADNGADIVNMSFGGYDISHTERLAIEYCAGKGVLLVAAAGNEGVDAPLYPAGFREVLAVASISETLDMTRSYFSNYGVWTDIGAPGISLYSTLVGGGPSYATRAREQRPNSYPPLPYGHPRYLLEATLLLANGLPLHTSDTLGGSARSRCCAPATVSSPDKIAACENVPVTTDIGPILSFFFSR